MEIARITPDDLHAVARLHAHFWGEVSDVDRMRESLERLQGDPDYCLLCARLDGQVAGTATGVVCHGLYGGFDSYLIVEDVVVDPGFRRRGVASALLGELELFAVEQACSHILLQTETCREDAVGLYESAGFDGVTRQGFKKKL